MSGHRIKVMYGKLEGTEGKFARDPSGYLSIEAGIFQKHGIEVSWEHVQGTEERYRRLGTGEAHISMVVGRAALAHFLASRRTRILGCAMNSCPYYLVVSAGIEELRQLKGKVVACRESPARNAPLAETFQAEAKLRLGDEIALQLRESDQRVFELLAGGQVQAALLPRPYAFIAEERGLKRVKSWPDVVDDPLPITIETNEALWQEMNNEFATFLKAHSEGIRYLKTHRDATIRLLESRFGHSPSLAAKSFDDYLICLDDRLTVDFGQLRKLLVQVAPDASGRVDRVASEWVVPGALRE